MPHSGHISTEFAMSVLAALWLPAHFLARPRARIWRNHAEIDAFAAALQRYDAERTALSDDRRWSWSKALSLP